MAHAALSPELARETAPVWEKVKDFVTPIEWPVQAQLIHEIIQTQMKSQK